MIYKHYLVILLLLFLLVSAGCASVPKDQSAERFFWPPLPDRPRIEWINAISSQLDIDRTPFQRFKEALVGSDAPISLVKPISALHDPDHDRLFVSDIGAGSVYIFDFKKHELRFLAVPEHDPPLAIISPHSLALDQAGNIYLLERRFNMIIVFDSSEKFIRAIPIGSIARKPISMTIDQRQGHILIADGDAHRVSVLDMEGKPLFSFGKLGVDEGEFNLPISVATTSKGDIVVADVFNARVQIFDKTGSFKRAFGNRGTGVGDFQLIKSVAVDSDDNIYVADGRSHQIKIFNTNGELLLVFGDFYAVSSSGKKAPGGFAVPVSIQIDRDDRISIVDQLNARVQIFQYLSETYLKAHPIPGAQY